MNKRKLFLQRLLLLIEKNINYKQNKFRSYKPNKGYTSELDIKVNNFLFKSIKEYFPNDTIISEESLKTNEIQKNYSECNIWIIDPICGTTNQVRQIPIFANSVSILQKNNDIAAGIYDVNRSELFFTDGKRTTLNGKKVNTSKIKKLGDAVISINCNQSSNKINRNKIENIIKKIAPPITRRIKIFESANLEMAYVASGRIDAYINPATPVTYFGGVAKTDFLQKNVFFSLFC